MTRPFDPIEVPTVAPDWVDYEGELGVVIGTRCRSVAADRAHEVVAGYVIVNDVSVRDWQRATQTMTMGKSWDTHGPIGPWMVTSDELTDAQKHTVGLIEEHEINAGGPASSWNPQSHSAYWTDDSFVRPVAVYLKTLLTAMDA